MRYCILIMLFLWSLISFAQTKITGTVHTSAEEKPLYNAKVTLQETGEEVITDRIGYFQFMNISPGIYTLQISMEGYARYQEKIKIQAERIYELGDIYLTFNPQNSDLGIITLSSEEFDAEENTSGAPATLLSATKGVFLQTVAYDWGAFWFRPRGLNNENSSVLLNGISMNKISHGRVDYGNWGGLNDIIRYPEESAFGINSTDHAFGDLGGLTYYETRPSKLRTGTGLSYSLTNRSYRQRLMLTHNTGLMKNGWGIAASASRRWANEGRIPGTFYDAWAYFLGIEKKLKNHFFNLSILGAPYRRAGNNPNTNEAYNLKGINYNAYWGYQNGVKRSERVKDNFEPIFQLSHHWNINLKNQLKTTLSYQTGYNKYSRLNWYKANNPSPIYYRNLPSYFYYLNTRNKENLTDDEKQKYDSQLHSWRNDENWSQINWENLYRANLNLNSYAAYYLANDVNKDDAFGLYSHLRSQLNENTTLNIGFQLKNTHSHNFREVYDLLGASYALNLDDFSDNSFSGKYNENDQNLQKKEGEIIEYNYKINHHYYEIFSGLNYKKSAWNVNLMGKMAYTAMQRNGLFKHYAHGNSFGKSKDLNFTDFGGKLNILYRINGNHYLRLNGAFFTKAPSASAAFPLGRYSNTFQPDIRAAEMTSLDFSYLLRTPDFKGNLTAFYTISNNETQTSFGYIQLVQDNAFFNKNLFIAEVLNGVQKEYKGIELSLEGKISKTLAATAVASIGEYIYKNNPNLYYFSDDYASSDGYKLIGKTYLKNYKLPGTPQQAYHLGLQYRSPKYWWVGLSANYFKNQYINISPSRRTDNFTHLPNGKLYKDLQSENAEALLRKVLKQEKFSNEMMLNLNAGKTFRLGQYYMGISLSINNLLNNKNFKTSGFEQLRLGNYEAAANENYSKVFGNKYWYNQGLNYFLNVFLRF